MENDVYIYMAIDDFFFKLRFKEKEDDGEYDVSVCYAEKIC